MSGYTAFNSEFESTTDLSAAGAPAYLTGILEALRFRNPSTERLGRLGHAEWQALLDWCDVRQLTFLLPSVCGASLPRTVQERISECLRRYTKRFLRLRHELLEISNALHNAGLSFVLLKGLTHSPSLTPNPVMRAQGDIDFWLLNESVYDARKVLQELGYVARQSSNRRHLAPMVRPSSWKWRGDRFDPDMPIAVELHYDLWSTEAEYIPLSGLNNFWDRKEIRVFEGCAINALCREDLLGFAALHLLLHLLHGELPMQRAWEIASFLHREAKNESFWDSWRCLHSCSLRQLEVLVFQLVRMWFACNWSTALEREAASLPESVRLWINQFSLSPLKAQFRPNKDDLWLHLALVGSPISQIRILLRRLVPFCLPGFADRGVETPRLSRIFRQRGLLMARAAHHASTLLPTLCQGLRWMWLCR